jgi:hypothetical protein
MPKRDHTQLCSSGNNLATTTRRHMRTLEVSNAKTYSSSTTMGGGGGSCLRRSSANLATFKKKRLDEESSNKEEQVGLISTIASSTGITSSRDDDDEKRAPVADEEWVSPGEDGFFEEASRKISRPALPPTVELLKQVEGKRSKALEELSRESPEARECFRHAIVDVPALFELLELVGRCPICKAPLHAVTTKNNIIIHNNSQTVVDLCLKCTRSRCHFTKLWCSSATAGIFSAPPLAATPARGEP